MLSLFVTFVLDAITMDISTSFFQGFVLVCNCDEWSLLEPWSGQMSCTPDDEPFVCHVCILTDMLQPELLTLQQARGKKMRVRWLRRMDPGLRNFFVFIYALQLLL